MRRLALGFSVLILAATASAAGPLFPKDTVIVQKVTTSRGESSTLTYFLSGNRMKTLSEGGGRTAVRIFDFATQRIWLVDPVGKKFSQVTFDDLKARYEEGWKKFRQLPSEEQNKRRALAIGTPPPKIEATEELATIAGLSARKWKVNIESRDQEIWASPEFALPIEVDELQLLFLPISGPLGDVAREHRRMLRQIKGFFLRRVETKGAPNETFTETTETTSIRRDVKIAPNELEVPAGFTRVEAATPATDSQTTVSVPPPTVRASANRGGK